MKKRITVRDLFNKAVLILLLVAAFNLSFHVTESESLEKFGSASTFLDEQEFILLPFGQQESTAPLLQLASTGFISLPEWQTVDHWIPIEKTVSKLELFYRQNVKSLKEYPFIILVRKLRI